MRRFPAMLQEPLTFNDVAVSFSEDEWKGLKENQKNLYREVMRDNYCTLSSLGLTPSKPEIVVKIEKGEDPCGIDASDGLQQSSTKRAKRIFGIRAHLEPRWNLRTNIPLRCNRGQKIVKDGDLGEEDTEGWEGIGSLPGPGKRTPQVCRKGVSSARTTIISPAQTASSHHREIGVLDLEQLSVPPKEQWVESQNIDLEPNDDVAMSLWKSTFKEEDPAQEKKQLSEFSRSATKPFMCMRCGENWDLLSDLLSHQMGQCQVRPFRCSICAKSFVKKQHLSAHRKTHTEDKPYTCGQCGRSFRQSSTLTTHLWSHAGLKPFHCSCCPKRFSRKTDLVAHMRRHTGERPFECPYCWDRFIRKKSLQRHLQKHTGETLNITCPNRKIKHNSLKGSQRQGEHPREALSSLAAPMQELCFRWNEKAEMKPEETDKLPILDFTKNASTLEPTEAVKMEPEEETLIPHIPQTIKTKQQMTQTEPQKKQQSRLHQNMLWELKRFRRSSIRSQQEWDSMRLAMNQLSEEVKELKEMMAVLCAAKSSTSPSRSAADHNGLLVSTSYSAWKNPERKFSLRSDDRLSGASDTDSPESSLVCTPSHSVENLSEPSKGPARWPYVTSSHDAIVGSMFSSSHDADTLLPTMALTPIKNEDDLEADLSHGRGYYGAPEYSGLEVGERLPNINMLPLSAEKERTLLAKSVGKPGRFAALVFRALVPFDLYKGWVNNVNLDGLKGRKGIPLNVKRRLMAVVGRHFTLRTSEHREIRNRLNEQLRSRRTRDKHPHYFF
uniref:Uncharacterized protein n=1 Tax=Leptobrachium leishanense TaxID=445787 RepID=A0A8C5MZD1_9ANUR